MVFSAARAGKGARQQWSADTSRVWRPKKSVLLLAAAAALAGMGLAMLAYLSVGH